MLGSRVGSSFGGVLVCDMAASRDCSGSPGMPEAELGSAAEPSREVKAPWLGVLTGTTGDAMRGVLAGAPASTLVLMVKPPAGTAPETHTKLSATKLSADKPQALTYLKASSHPICACSCICTEKADNTRVMSMQSRNRRTAPQACMSIRCTDVL